jgi:hypothetical protein
MQLAVEKIRDRVDSLGVSEPEILCQGDTIVVNLPGVKNQQQAVDLVQVTGLLLDGQDVSLTQRTRQGLKPLFNMGDQRLERLLGALAGLVVELVHATRVCGSTRFVMAYQLLGIGDELVSDRAGVDLELAVAYGIADALHFGGVEGAITDIAGELRKGGRQRHLDACRWRFGADRSWHSAGLRFADGGGVRGFFELTNFHDGLL